MGVFLLQGNFDNNISLLQSNPPRLKVFNQTEIQFYSSYTLPPFLFDQTILYMQTNYLESEDQLFFFKVYPICILKTSALLYPALNLSFRITTPGARSEPSTRSVNCWTLQSKHFDHCIICLSYYEIIIKFFSFQK